AAVRRVLERVLVPDSALLLVSTLESACERRQELGDVVWPIVTEWAKRHHAGLSDVALWSLLRVRDVGIELAAPVVQSGRRFGVLTPGHYAVVNRDVEALSSLLVAPGALAADGAGNTPFHYLFNTSYRR